MYADPYSKRSDTTGGVFVLNVRICVLECVHVSFSGGEGREGEEKGEGTVHGQAAGANSTSYPPVLRRIHVAEVERLVMAPAGHLPHHLDQLLAPVSQEEMLDLIGFALSSNRELGIKSRLERQEDVPGLNGAALSSKTASTRRAGLLCAGSRPRTTAQLRGKWTQCKQEAHRRPQREAGHAANAMPCKEAAVPISS